ncbi:hypothetical protein [Nocardia niwae]|uniref:hypothetical protein n=1 Tax=Nocardia niwae TaxID=626084 RepID=UPI0007A5008A|nr:hypothetical protein [Nocardia niwae]
MSDEGWEARMAARARQRATAGEARPACAPHVPNRTPYTHDQLWALVDRWYDQADGDMSPVAATIRRCADELIELLGPRAYADSEWQFKIPARELTEAEIEHAQRVLWDRR